MYELISCSGQAGDLPGYTGAGNLPALIRRQSVAFDATMPLARRSSHPSNLVGSLNVIEVVLYGAPLRRARTWTGWLCPKIRT